MSQHSQILAVDPWWMEEVTARLDRVKMDAQGAREALDQGSPSRIRTSLRNLLVSQRALDDVLRSAIRHIVEA